MYKMYLYSQITYKFIYVPTIRALFRVFFLLALGVKCPKKLFIYKRHIAELHPLFFEDLYTYM